MTPIAVAFARNLEISLAFIFSISCEILFLRWVFSWSPDGVIILFGQIRSDQITPSAEVVWAGSFIIHIMVLLWLFWQMGMPMYWTMTFGYGLFTRSNNRKQK